MIDKKKINALSIHNDILKQMLYLYYASSDVRSFSQVCKSHHTFFYEPNDSIMESIIHKKKDMVFQFFFESRKTIIQTTFHNKPLLLDTSPKKNKTLKKYSKHNKTTFKKAKLKKIDTLHTMYVGKYTNFFSGTDAKDQPVLLAYGINGFGQLGTGDTKDRRKLTQIKLPKDLCCVDSVYIEEDFTFILGRDKKANPFLAAAGDNAYGQLASGDEKKRTHFTRITLPKDMDSVNQIHLGKNCTFLNGYDKKGAVILVAAGDNFKGQLGVGDFDCRKKWTKVKLPKEMADIDFIYTGSYFTVIVGRNKEGFKIIASCGNNGYGQLALGDPLYKSRNLFSMIHLPKRMVSMEKVEVGAHSLFVLGCDKDNKPLLAVAGNNRFGQLCTGDYFGRTSLTEVYLPNTIHSIESIQTGLAHCLIFGRDEKGKGVLFSCGNNNCGQLGRNDIRYSSKLTKLPLPKGMYDVDSIHVKYNSNFIVGRNKDNEIMIAAFGDNNCQKLGIASINNCISVPTVISRPEIKKKKAEMKLSMGKI